VGGNPVYLERGAGAVVEDADGRSYIDYVGAWGPMAVGHAHPDVVRAVAEQAARGLGFGAPNALETQLAQEIIDAVPGVEKIRFVTSGTEATMSAIRLARAFTGREKVLKFAGCYHGHADALLVQAGSGVATLALPDSPGVTKGAVSNTLVAPYNDLAAVEEITARHRNGIAAILVEPVAGNMGLVLPEAGFLSGLRRVADECGAVLVFDEVMSGFRAGPSGAGARFGVVPDLLTLGKVIGGGLPVGAYGGRAEIMELVAPQGPVYQAGTLAGNPVVMAAGLATLRVLSQPGVFAGAEAYAADLVDGLARLADGVGVPVATACCGTMFGLFFNTGPVHDFASAGRSDLAAYARWFHGMLGEGVYLAPSQFETGFVSAAHDERHLASTLAAAGPVLQAMRPIREGPPVC
jgi:glutamate-1-semialdehyde 2,1-aminomutase